MSDNSSLLPESSSSTEPSPPHRCLQIQDRNRGVPIVGVGVVVMVSGVPVRVELAVVVAGSSNTGVGLIGMISGVRIRIGLTLVVV
jgi:hypothetical protein